MSSSCLSASVLRPIPHEVSVRVDREAWEQATGVRYADLAENLDRRPAWTWS